MYHLTDSMVKLHNHFDIVAEDIETGEIQTARAENVVLDLFYSKIFDGVNNAGGLSTTCVGTGTNTPQKTDIALQSQVLARTASANPIYWDYSQLKQGGTGVVVFSSVMQIEATELVGSVLTEVGLSYTNLCTRALLQDANGNPISITKTNTMVVKIYATAYFTMPTTISGYKVTARFNGTGVPWDMAEYRFNMLSGLKDARLLSKRRDRTWFEPAKGASILTPPEADLTMTGTKDTVNKRITYSYASLPVGSGNIGGIRAIGISYNATYGSFIEIPVPNDTIVQPVITKEVIATGDGITTQFASKFGWIRNNGTAKVFVNDEEQTSGVTLKYDRPSVAHTNAYLENTGLTNSLGSPTFENMTGAKLKKVYATGRNGDWLMASNNPSGVFEQVVQTINKNQNYDIPAAFQSYRYWGSVTSYHISQGAVNLIAEGDIQFDVPPPVGATIALTYQPDCIAKDDTRIINNLSYVLAFNW